MTELVSIFQQEQMLHAPHPLNTALLSLQPQDVPAFYKTMVEKVAIQPNASSVALVIRAFGQLHQLAEAEAVLKEWQVYSVDLIIVLVIPCYPAVARTIMSSSRLHSRPVSSVISPSWFTIAQQACQQGHLSILVHNCTAGLSAGHLSILVQAIPN